jgi:hypothetical protein
MNNKNTLFIIVRIKHQINVIIRCIEISTTKYLVQ